MKGRFKIWLSIAGLGIGCSSNLKLKPKSSLEIIPGCEGEACECLAAYQKASEAGKSLDFPVRTVRPFTLYRGFSSDSETLGKFVAGVRATSTGPSLVIHEKGRYRVARAPRASGVLKVGDELDTLLHEGEGFFRARRDGQWVRFQEEEDGISLETLVPTRARSWTGVDVNGQKGQTPDTPFEFCLE